MQQWTASLCLLKTTQDCAWLDSIYYSRTFASQDTLKVLPYIAKEFAKTELFNGFTVEYILIYLCEL